MSINEEATKKLFEKLATYGALPEGGITRLTWSPSFKEAQNYLKAYMEDIGMSTEIDQFGNLIGTVAGTEDLAPIYTGSHLDSVPVGGTFDGALGIVAGISCAYTWFKEKYKPRRPLKVVAFAEEEGIAFGCGCYGSQALCGELAGKSTDSIVSKDGTTLSNMLEAYGAPLQAFKTKSAFSPESRFVEMHIEQGRFLDEKHLSVGVVSAIVGIKRFQVLIKGTANHAGTTSMDHRQDALVAASTLVRDIYHDALASNNLYVATVGSLNVTPNAENVVPGQVQFCVEIRAAASETIEQVKESILAKFAGVSAEYGVTIEEFRETNIAPVPMDKHIQDVMIQEANKLCIEYMSMPSWAGHDSMIMARYMPTGMLFVPSINGLSHSPAELTAWEDIYKGINVLDGTLRELCK